MPILGSGLPFGGGAGGLSTASGSPVGLALQQTITSGTSVTFPAGINWAYALLVGGGGGGATASGGSFAGAGGAGGVTVGWIRCTTTTACVIGAGGGAAATGDSASAAMSLLMGSRSGCEIAVGA